MTFYTLTREFAQLVQSPTTAQGTFIDHVYYNKPSHDVIVEVTLNVGKPPKLKQEVTIADATSSFTVTLWEANVNSLNQVSSSK